jgi:hypothetical protein
MNVAYNFGDYPVYMTLSEVKTMDDFKHWKSEIGHRVSSTPVSGSKLSNLDSFFA